VQSVVASENGGESSKEQGKTVKMTTKGAAKSPPTLRSKRDSTIGKEVYALEMKEDVRLWMDTL